MDPLDRELLALRDNIAALAARAAGAAGAAAGGPAGAGDAVEPRPGESAARFYRRVVAHRARSRRPAMPDPVAQAVLSGSGRPRPRPSRPTARYLVLVVLLVMASLATGAALWIGAGLRAGADGGGIGPGEESRTTVETRDSRPLELDDAAALPAEDPPAGAAQR